LLTTKHLHVPAQPNRFSSGGVSLHLEKPVSSRRVRSRVKLDCCACPALF
jgi:hypothetical protein